MAFQHSGSAHTYLVLFKTGLLDNAIRESSFGAEHTYIAHIREYPPPSPREPYKATHLEKIYRRCLFFMEYKQRGNKQTIKFTAGIADTEIHFLDTCVYKDERFKKEPFLDVRTHFKQTETF